MFVMKPFNLKKSPFLYGASFLLALFGSNLVVHRRLLRGQSDHSGSIRNGFNAIGSDFAKLMPRGHRS